jgi:hypothetical protein
MQAQIINRFGSPDVFEAADIPVPQVLPMLLVSLLMQARLRLNSQDVIQVAHFTSLRACS